MTRTTTKKPQALVADEAALEERRQVNTHEREQAEAELARLEGEKTAALRDGAAGRERARDLLGSITAQKDLLTLLDEERRVIESDALMFRARQEVQALRKFERQVRDRVERVAAAAEGVEETLGGLSEEMRDLHAAMQAFFAFVEEQVSPPPEACRRLAAWPWWDGIVEQVATMIADLLGRNPTPVPLVAPVRRVGAAVGDPDALSQSIVRDATRPEALAAKYREAPALAEAVRRLLEGGESHVQA